eukprot:NODE_586_length_6373_cov_0.635480.p3 type:complete len:340 gc:universal NODE_586_length_6373_cov_0.635480:5080-4061(-)
MHTHTHTLIFPTYLVPKGGCYKGCINARLYEQDKIQLLRNSKHFKKDWRQTLKLLISNLRYTQPKSAVQIRCSKCNYEMKFDKSQQRYLCDFEISEMNFMLLSVEYNHLRLLPVYGITDKTPYYLIRFPQRGMAVISDIDDTMIVTHAYNLINGFKSIVQGYNIVPGIDTLYTKLAKLGWDFHYITSSPDIFFSMFYPLIQPFSPYKIFPMGTYHSISSSKNFIRSSNRFAHKVHNVVDLLSSYPEKDFILIGDNGQHDIEIYALILQILGSDCKRIKAIYIRDVTQKQINRIELNHVSQESLLTRKMTTCSNQTAIRYFSDGKHLEELILQKFKNIDI